MCVYVLNSKDQNTLHIIYSTVLKSPLGHLCYKGEKKNPWYVQFTVSGKISTSDLVIHLRHEMDLK